MAVALTSEASYIINECTWFVAHTLSWIPGGLGDAKDWYARFKAKGGPVSQVPVVGDVAVFAPRSPYDSSAGHVAIVQQVNKDWSIVVSEMNFTNGLGKTDTRTISAATWPRQVIGFLVSPGNAAPGPTAFGSSTPRTSRQTDAESFYQAGLPNGGIASAQGPSTDSGFISGVGGFDFSALQTMLKFITDPKEWWRIFIVLIALVLVFIGVTGYFAPRAARVSPIPV